MHSSPTVLLNQVRACVRIRNEGESGLKPFERSIKHLKTVATAICLHTVGEECSQENKIRFTSFERNNPKV